MRGQLDFALNLNNEGFTGGTLQAQHALHGLGQGVMGTRASMHAMEQVFTAFGGEIAPQVTSRVMTLTSGMHALRAVAMATGVSIAGIGIASIGVVGLLATLSAAVEFAHAKLEEGESGARLVENLVENRARILERIQKLYAIGKLGKEEAISLQVRLALAPDSEAELGAAIREVSKRVREAQGPAVDLKALTEMGGIERRVRADGLAGAPRVTAELDIAVADFTNKVSTLGKAAGYGEKEINALINVFAGQKRSELEKQFTPVTEEKPGKLAAAPSASSLERLGFVMNNSRAMNDPGRETAANTRLMFAEQKQTNRLLSEKTKASIVHE